MARLEEIAAVTSAKDGDWQPLADLIRNHADLSQRTRDFIADELQKLKKKKRGRPSDPNARVRRLHRLLAWHHLRRLKARYRRLYGQRCPHECALEHVVKHHPQLSRDAREGETAVDVLDRICSEPGKYLRSQNKTRRI